MHIMLCHFGLLRVGDGFKSSSRIKWTLHVEMVKTIQPIEIYNHLNSNGKL